MMRILSAVLVALVLTEASAHATVLVGADLEELVRDARAIVRGRVVAVEGRWTADRRAIETLVTLDVDGYLKGSLGSTLQFLVPGGDLGRYRTVFVGAPEFVEGERVVVCLGSRGPSMPYVLGLSRGVFRVAAATDRSGWLVLSPALLPSAVGSARLVRGDPARQPMPLADFEARVRALAGGSR